MTRLNAYINDFWERVTRVNNNDQDTLIGLPYPYLIPASDPNNLMFQEMYYWDSYFMALGLVGTAHEQRIVDMAENMAYLIERFGFVPNGSRYYFTSRSQPPFFTRMVSLAHAVLQKKTPNLTNAFLSRMLTEAIREHDDFWMNKQLPLAYRRVVTLDKNRYLNRYGDVNALHLLASCESGWDHSARCDGDLPGSEAGRWLDFLPVCLNSILYVVENDIADMSDMLGDSVQSQHWRNVANARAQTMQDLFWHEPSGFFYDYDWVSKKLNFHVSLAGFYPLWAGWATQSQAERIVREWLSQFMAVGGVVTSLSTYGNRQWALPNGWAPLQWIVASGLDRYGYRAEAHEIRRRWCAMCEFAFENDGTLLEKYNVMAPELAPSEGVYGTVMGFGWTNGVYVDFARTL
jgi:alpha,alpha-trehalase